jgi:ankyrin repeat protein
MSTVDSSDIYYPISWIKTTTNLILSLFSSPQKTKRSLAEEAECGSVDGIKCWLREGADINAADAYGYTPLMNAAMLGRLDIVKALIESGADIQKKGQFGYTALHAAAQSGHLDVVQALVRYGASVNCKNDDGDIPLILAVRGTHAEIIDYLLKAGSDIHQNGWLGQSAVHTAIANGDQATADALLNREMMIGCSCSESHRHAREHLRQVSCSSDG